MRGMNRSRRRAAAGATLVGVACGLLLLADLRPGKLDPPVVVQAAAPARHRAKHRPAPHALRVEAPRAEAAPVEVAAPPPARAEVAADELAVVIVDVVDEDGRPADDAMVLAVDCPGFSGGPPGEYVV